MGFVPHMLPGRVVTWEHFQTQMPERSIALDGFVYGPPQIDVARLQFNFDHHAGPPRSCMHCTAVQVLEQIRTDDFVELLMPRGDENVLVWMNDPDPDVALSWYALTHHYIVRDPVNPAVNRLFGHVQSMDKSSGLLAVPRDMPIVGQSAWIFEPYWNFRMSGAIDQKNAAAYIGVLWDIVSRINEFVASRGHNLDIDDRYETLGGGQNWSMVREIGPHARMKMARHGIRAFVSARQKGDGRWVYTVCRKSTYATWFPVPEICAFLNRDEDPADHFGGGDIVFGNARGNGSARGPDEIASAINSFLREHNVCAP